jgi:hypothetical protein
MQLIHTIHLSNEGSLLIERPSNFIGEKSQLLYWGTMRLCDDAPELFVKTT